MEGKGEIGTVSMLMLYSDILSTNVCWIGVFPNVNKVPKTSCNLMTTSFAQLSPTVTLLSVQILVPVYHKIQYVPIMLIRFKITINQFSSQENSNQYLAKFTNYVYICMYLCIHLQNNIQLQHSIPVTVFLLYSRHLDFCSIITF